MKYTIRTPLPGVTGIHAGINFTGGVATIDDSVKEEAAALAYFQQAGYTIEPVDEPEPVEDEEVVEPAAMPAKNASTEDWRAYAVAQGMPEDEANAATRDALVDRYTKGAGQ